MQEQKHETRARKAKLAVSYITCGILMVVWAVVWLLYLMLPEAVNGWIYIASGLVLSGIAVAMIGMKVGQICMTANEDEERDVATGVEAPKEVDDDAVRRPPTDTDPATLEPRRVVEPSYKEYKVGS